jgi:hypothetical protein
MEPIRETIKRVLKEQTEDLEFIDSYWRETNRKLEEIISKIKSELPVMDQPSEIQSDIDSKLKLKNYSDIRGWDGGSRSKSLEALADKIEHMIRTGKSDGIKRMVEKIATGRVKSLSKPDWDSTEYLGKGHFRWNNQAYLLSKEEVDRVKEFFKL